MEIPRKITELIKKRGIAGGEELQEFLSLHPKKTYDPYLLKDMDAGVELILSAAEDGKKICIYGDYDADGITASVLLAEVLSNLTNNLSIHVPSRFTEGFGLNKKSVKELHDKGAELLVTVDTGSVDTEEVEYAKSLGMDVLITDHHQISDRMADAPVINPCRPGDGYPFKGLAGCGVAFKLAQAIARETGLPGKVTTGVLDLLAIGTIGDVVPLVDENRTLVKYGLKVINSRNRRNLDFLISASGFTPGRIGAEEVAYGIVPRLNAAGRIEHASIACSMFLEKDGARARETVDRLVRLNNYRRELQDRIFRMCQKDVEEKFADDSFLLVENNMGGEGVAGIVAGNLKEMYYRPVCVITRTDDGTWKGSGRSIEGVDLYALLKQNEEMFTAFGGHPAACGFTLKEGMADTLRANLNRETEKIRKNNPGLFRRKVRVDIRLEPGDITPEFIDAVNMLEPCGAGNERPAEALEAYPGDIRTIGKEGQYLSFTAVMSGGRKVRCASFRNVEKIRRTLEKAPGRVLLIGNLRKNEWKGETGIEMTVENAKAL